jgi:small subunit ribosomal protein S16
MVGILEPQYRVGKIAGMVVKSGSASKSLIKEGRSAEAEPGVVVENMEGGTKETAA